MKFPTRELNRIIIHQWFWNLKQDEPKYVTNSVPWQLLSGRGTKTSKYGTYRKIRDAWQAYLWLVDLVLNYSLDDDTTIQVIFLLGAYNICIPQRSADSLTDVYYYIIIVRL